MTNLDYLAKKEWWITNNLGGWASSTISGANTSKYHGLFVISNFAGNRTMLVSTLDEYAICSNEKYELSTHFYKNAIHPQGYKNILDFSFDGFVPRWTFDINGQRLAKEIWVGKRLEQTYIRYTLLEGEGLGLNIIPLFANRNIHAIGSNPIFLEQLLFSPREIKFFSPISWGIVFSRGISTKHNYTYYDFFYQLQAQKKEPNTENLFSLFAINAYLKEGQNLEICFLSSLQPYVDVEYYNYAKSFLVPKIFNVLNSSSLMGLLRASEAYFLYSENKPSICAGYPYFWQWARDSFISLPGLCLPLNKKQIFLEIVLNWIEKFKQGLLQNRLDYQPIYESVDGTLWLIWALGEFEKRYNFIPKKIIKKLEKEFDYWFLSNEFFEIDSDGLILLKKPRLTWMDVSLNGSPLNPRIGKPIEINALWVYALRKMLDWTKNNFYLSYLQKAQKSMLKFYCKKENYLYDCIDPIDSSFRPNQLWAFALLPDLFENKAKALSLLKEKLFVKGCGFYSLSKEDKNFVLHYSGSQEERDIAYHNGAIWPFFIGAYTQAWLEAGLDPIELKKDLLSIINSSTSGALFHLPEVYDPATLDPAGCPLQAWSVGETIRAAFYLSYYLKYNRLFSQKHNPFKVAFTKKFTK